MKNITREEVVKFVDKTTTQFWNEEYNKIKNDLDNDVKNYSSYKVTLCNKVNTSVRFEDLEIESTDILDILKELPKNIFHVKIYVDEMIIDYTCYEMKDISVIKEIQERRVDYYFDVFQGNKNNSVLEAREFKYYNSKK